MEKFKHIFYINWLFGSVKLTKTAGLDKYKYRDYDIGFDSCSEFLFIVRSFGINIINFWS